MKRWFSLLSILCLFVGCVVDEHSDENPPADDSSLVRVGDRLPQFTVQVTDGDETYAFSSAAASGPTVVVFFNTSCKDCQRELPQVEAFWQQHRGDPGFRLVAIAREESAESIAAYWQDHGLTMPYSPQDDRRVYNLFATLTIPRVYFCSADGVITWMGIEQFTLPTSI